MRHLTTLGGLAAPGGPLRRVAAQDAPPRLRPLNRQASGMTQLARVVFPTRGDFVFSRFFIDRPIFASVLSIVITLAGVRRGVHAAGRAVPRDHAADRARCRPSTPAPTPRSSPTPSPRRSSSRSTASRTCCTCRRSAPTTAPTRLTVTFKLGIDLNMAQVLVQNRVVAGPAASCPTLVQAPGVTVKKKSPSILMIVNLISPDGRYDNLYLSNYATIQLKDELLRAAGRRRHHLPRPARLQHARLARPGEAGRRAT